MKKEYIPFAIMGGVALTLIGVGIYFRRQLKQAVLDLNDYLFTDNISYHIKQLNPAYQKLFADFVAKIIKMGYKVQINSSYRDFLKQAQQHKDDARNAPAGSSMHNYGLALDLQVSKNGKVYGKSTSDAEWLSTGIPQLAKSMGLEWGGDFVGYQDAVHFSVKGFTGAQLQALAYKQFGTTNPSKIEGNKLKLA